MKPGLTEPQIPRLIATYYTQDIAAMAGMAPVPRLEAPQLLVSRVTSSHPLPTTYMPMNQP